MWSVPNLPARCVQLTLAMPILSVPEATWLHLRYSHLFPLSQSHHSYPLHCICQQQRWYQQFSTRESNTRHKSSCHQSDCSFLLFVLNYARQECSFTLVFPNRSIKKNRKKERENRHQIPPLYMLALILRHQSIPTISGPPNRLFLGECLFVLDPLLLSNSSPSVINKMSNFQQGHCWNTKTIWFHS